MVIKKKKIKRRNGISAFNKYMGLSVCGFEEKIIDRMKRMGGEF